MAAERPSLKDNPHIQLDYSKGSVDVQIGRGFRLFGRRTWVLQKVTDEKEVLASGRVVPVVLISNRDRTAVDDFYLPRVDLPTGEVMYKILGDTVAHSIINMNGA